VFVGGYCKFIAPAQAAALEHGASVSRRHATAETMYAHAAADFRLIRTFGHSTFLISKIIAKAKTGTTLYRKGFDSVNLDSRAIAFGLFIRYFVSIRANFPEKSDVQT
jgi:hypothetical protein